VVSTQTAEEGVDTVIDGAIDDGDSSDGSATRDETLVVSGGYKSFVARTDPAAVRRAVKERALMSAFAALVFSSRTRVVAGRP